ncbi:MAG: hypothetical protein AB203_04245 [Parcubacteria bacterium C7867-008]|nr:MAG: hypothetical protein AB203_04245 [Parcubacteria bacterium C7867-008]
MNKLLLSCALLAFVAPNAQSKEYRIGDTVHHEEPESTAAATVAHCLLWPRDTEYTLQFTMRSQDKEARKWITEGEVIERGRPIVVTVHPYKGEEYRTCTERSATPKDLQLPGKEALAVLQLADGSKFGYAVRKISEEGDSFEFLAAGPVPVSKHN